jgi:cytochrome P450
LNAISYLLSCNPEAQKKLQEEADSILGTPENRSEMTAEELTNLLDEDFVKQFPYANAVIQESNRLLPVASLLDGQLTKDLVIDGYYLKKKTTLLVMTRVAALRSCPTPDPFKFKPERWLDCTPEERRQHDKMAWGFVSDVKHPRILIFSFIIHENTHFSFRFNSGWWPKNMPWPSFGFYGVGCGSCCGILAIRY